jgi:predicted nucleic acid-binding protein
VTLYVESNFVLELALSQEHWTDAEALLVRAERRQMSLAIPAVSISEPFSTVTNRSRLRRAVIDQLDRQIEDLRRSHLLQDDVNSIELTPAILNRVKEHETELLISTLVRVLDVATVIPIDAAVFREALENRIRFPFDPMDAVIFSSVAHHLRSTTEKGPHLFVTKDKRDFRKSGIAELLRALDCELLRSFAEAQVLLELPLPD